MPDKENENSSSRGEDRSFRSEQEKARLNLEKINQYEQQLLNDTRFREYASSFSDYSVQNFIKEFASAKVRWTEWGDKYAKWKETDDLQWQEKAMEMLKEIQQKKLFDLQCLWRAEKIKLRGMEICYDFVYWEANIFGCPALPHINDEEAEIYLSYLKSGNYQVLNGSGLWQNYEAIKQAYNNEDYYMPYPEWYSFYDSRKGTSANLLLPDIRGDKERFYIALSEKEKKENAPEPHQAAAPVPSVDTKPSLEYTKDGFMERFIKTFDTPETYKFYKAISDTSEHQNEDVEEMIGMLSQAENNIPIRKNNDWVEGVMGAAAELCRQKCLEIFPAVYQEYKMYIENKLQGNVQLGMAGFLFRLQELQRQIEIQKIFRGRELNGEPRDLNF